GLSEVAPHRARDEVEVLNVEGLVEPPAALRLGNVGVGRVLGQQQRRRIARRQVKQAVNQQADQQHDRHRPDKPPSEVAGHFGAVGYRLSLSARCPPATGYRPLATGSYASAGTATRSPTRRRTTSVTLRTLAYFWSMSNRLIA